MPTNDRRKRKRKRRKSGFVRDMEALYARILDLVALLRKSLSNFFVNGRLIFIVSLTVIAILATVFVVQVLTGKNSYEVFVNDTSVGFLALNKTITEEALFNVAKAKLEANLNTKVQINEKIKLLETHATKKQIKDNDTILSKIYELLTYSVEAVVITVDGVEMAIVKDEVVWDTIENNLKKPYYQEGLNIISADFVENVKDDKRFVEIKEIIPPDKAYTILSATTESEKTYNAVDGDSLWKIAAKADMTLDELKSLNPGINPNLKLGQEVKIRVLKPVLSIKTVEEVKYPEVIKKETEYRENANFGKGYSRVIQQGSDGQRVVTAQIIRVNGIDMDHIVTDWEVTIPVKNDIIEIGK